MFLILPNQLYDKKFINIDEKIVIYEHPHYFTKYNYNKKKLILHRASMKYYYEYLKNNGYDVLYIDYNKKLPNNNYNYFDPIDEIKIKGTMFESPNFIMTKIQYEKYRTKTDKFTFTNFYMWCKKEINLYPELSSKDKMNRQIYKGTIQPTTFNNNSNIFVVNAIKYVEKHFSNNYGDTNNFFYPITHKTAKEWLNTFLKNKLHNFGPYQDYVKQNNTYMFHSILSSSINIGLLNPMDIIKELHKYKNKVPINSFEGYLRQLFWREYQRYTFIYIDWKGANYFGNNKKLSSKWYEGNTGILPVDDLIKSGFKTGYIHHIGRLMFIGNYMNLSGISPNEGVKWFMEFAIDSYEWVMQQNVRDMVFFVSGGMTMRKPYITSSNYILKMSDYKKGEWSDKWNDLYKKFLKKNKIKLWKFRYNFPTL